MQRKFVQAFHVPGELGADLNIRWTAPSDCTLVHVSAVSSDADAAGLTIGTSVTAAAYLAKCSAGVSNTPVEKARTDFVGTQYPQISDGDIVAIAVDYNYAGGGSASASSDVTIVLTFQEG
jgi:hypothetical protein